MWLTALVIGQHSGFMSVTQLTFCVISCFWCVKVKKYIRIRISIFRIFIWGSISSDICSEIMFSGSADVLLYKKIRPYIRRYTALNENFEYSYPLNKWFSCSTELSMNFNLINNEVPRICDNFRFKLPKPVIYPAYKLEMPTQFMSRTIFWKAK